MKQKNSVPKLQVYNNAFRNRFCQHTFDEARMNRTEWGRQVESAVGAYLAGKSVTDDFSLLYWRNERKKECDYVLKRGERLVAIEVKSGTADNVDGYLEFKNRYADNIVQAFVIGPEGLPLEDFFSLNVDSLFCRTYL
ncbi:MAG: DUF4143 domain-containing protein [Bacteroidales bacterium]|nr:DUF4143 domain-containing protein [Bacteroidales bacterium]